MTARAHRLDLLCDTHILLWAAAKPERLPEEAHALILSSRRYFSAASIWELAVKSSQARSGVPVNVPRLRAGLLRNGYAEVPVTSDHALATAALPLHHKDPFDRILLAQATREGLLFLTRDKQFAAYQGPIRLV